MVRIDRVRTYTQHLLIQSMDVGAGFKSDAGSAA